MTALNEIGLSEPSEASLSAIPNQVPEQPSPPTAEFGDRQLTVSWTPPDNAGTEITGYEIEIGPVSAIEQIGSDTSFVWQGLTNGQDYTFRVRAQNDAGFSPFSTLSASEHPSAPPEAPTIRATERGTLGGSLIARWSKPVDNGDDIIDYQVRSSQGGVNRVTGADTLSYIWSDLTNGAEISFEVRARNRAGWSPWSTPSIGVPPCGVPAAPTNVTAVRGDGRVELTWDEAVDNGCEVTGYTIATSSGAIQNSEVASHTFTGLVNGDPYSFNVRATNERGVSVASAPSSTVIPAGPLLCRNGSSLAATITEARSVDLAWLTAIDNGAPVIEYLIDTGTTPIATPNNSMTVRNLSDGTAYSFSVRARNEVGTSVPCGSADAITWAVPTDIQLTLDFDIETKLLTASATGGQSVDEATRLGYTWELSGTPGNVSNGQYPIPTGQVHLKSIDFEITEDGIYTVNVVGTNAAGQKTATASIEIELASPPDIMQTSDIFLSESFRVPSGTGALGTAVFADLTPPNDNGAPIIEYRWQARQYFGPGPRFGRFIAEGAEPASDSGTTFFRFDHLAGHSDYYASINEGRTVTWRLRVRAVNEEGEAEDWSEWVELTPPTPAATVSGSVTGSCGSDRSCVRLNLTGYGFTANASYNIEADGGGRSANCDSVSTGTGGDISASGLECNFSGGTDAPNTFDLTIDGVRTTIN